MHQDSARSRRGVGCNTAHARASRVVTGSAGNGIAIHCKRQGRGADSEDVAAGGIHADRVELARRADSEGSAGLGQRGQGQSGVLRAGGLAKAGCEKTLEDKEEK